MNRAVKFFAIATLVCAVLVNTPRAVHAAARQQVAPTRASSQLVHVRVALSAFQDVVSIYIGIEEGFYRQEGIAVDIQHTDWPGSNQLLVGGHTDLDTTSDADVALQNAQGNDTTLAFPLYFFAGGGLMYDPHRFTWTSYATFLKKTHGNRKEALRRTLKQAIGRKVGVSSGGAEYATFIGMIKFAGLPAKDFQIVNLSQEDLPPALLSGSIDIMIAGIPQRLAVLKHGYATLTDQTALPSTVAQCGYGAHRSWLNTHRALAAKIQKVIFKTMAFIQEHPDQAFPIISRHLREAGTIEDAKDIQKIWDKMEFFVHGKEWYQKQVVNPRGQFYWKDRFEAVVRDLKSSGKIKGISVPIEDLNYGVQVVASVK